MSEWQPIETAPKDGSLILIKEKGGRRVAAKWCCPGWHSSDWYAQLTGIGVDSYPTYDVEFWSPLPEEGK